MSVYEDEMIFFSLCISTCISRGILACTRKACPTGNDITKITLYFLYDHFFPFFSTMSIWKQDSIVRL